MAYSERFMPQAPTPNTLNTDALRHLITSSDGQHIPSRFPRRVSADKRLPNVGPPVPLQASTSHAVCTVVRGSTEQEYTEEKYH